MATKINANVVSNALETLEVTYGRTPSVKEVAELCKVSTATALYYLDDAVEKGLIVKRDGKFMTRAVADAFRQKE